MTSETLDLYELHKPEYITPDVPTLVDTEPAKYLTNTGKGEPGGEEFAMRLAALYNVAYATKMDMKSHGKDYAVCKLEGFWWGSKDALEFLHEPQSEWNWKLVIRTPDYITEEELEAVVENLVTKGKCPEVRDVQLETIGEGQCVQMLHVGPYDSEEATVAVMKKFVEEHDLALHGRHHEIYLSDPRSVEPEKLRTILRIPVH
jgi:hypothetical protein